MLTQIEVQDFKSLRRVRVELGQVNVFIGANGSGKTNLLEAIGLLGAAANSQVDDQALLRRGVRPGPPPLCESSFTSDVPPAITIEATWRVGEDVYEYRIGFERMGGVPQSWPRYWEEGIRNGQVIYQLDPQNIDPTPHGKRPSEIPSELDSFWSVLSDYAIFAPHTPTLRGEVTDITQRPPMGLAGGQLAEAVADLLDVEQGRFGSLDLDDLFELLDWVDRIDVVPPSREIVSPSVPTSRLIIRFTDHWMRRGYNQLPAYAASEGALYVLFALVLALHRRSPRLFALDNFDQAMHPRLARATARIFCQQMLRSDPPRQALLTTHNPLVLDGLDLRDDRIRLFAVERDSRGASRVHRIRVSEDVLQATQEGLSLSNLWVMGRLGGVPDLF